MRVPKTGFSLFLVAGFILTGCGGGSSSSSAAPVQTGYLVGGLVEALPYKCGDQKGNTGRLGQFSYKSGDSCEFSLGKNKFSVSADKVQKGYLTAYDLTATKDEAWTLMAIMMTSKLAAILKVNSTSNKNAGKGTINMPMINNTKAGMLRPVKLNRDRLCRNVDSDSVVIDYQSEIKGASST